MIRSYVLKYLPGAGKGKKEGSKEDIIAGANARRTVKKSKGVRVFEGNEVGENDAIEYLFLTRA